VRCITPPSLSGWRDPGHPIASWGTAVTAAWTDTLLIGTVPSYDSQAEERLVSRSRLTSRYVAASLAAALAVAGCAKNAQRGAVIGGAGGAVVGGVVGAATGSTAKGAIIGAAVGGAAGAIIGDQMDRRAREIDQDIPGAEVERVGEGILVTFESGILFGFDSTSIQPQGRENLRTLAANLDKYPDTDLLVVGHTDDVGADDYNQSLSERRARAAADYLVSQGVERSRLRTSGRGELEPVAENTSDAGRQENRRVEIAIYANEEMRQQAQEQAASGS
jgi:outer membrane protein OmpA-like peptidoglycan-associated protein